MDTTTFACGVTTILFLYSLIKFIVKCVRYNLPPGPMGMPIIGHVTNVTHVSLLNHRDRYGDISYMNVLGGDVVILNSADVIREACKGVKASAFSNRPETFSKNYILHEDIVARSPSETNWKQLKQVLHSLLRQYGDGKVELERVVTEELTVVIDNLENDVGLVIDIQDYLEPSLLNILFILLIGQRYDYKHWRISDVRRGLKTSNSAGNFLYDTLLAAFPSIRFIPFGQRADYKFYTEYGVKLLDYLLKKGRKYKETKSGIIYELFRLKEQHTWLTDDAICGVAQDIMFAGFTTTGNTLYSFILILLHYPDVQRKLQEEIDNVLGSRKPTIADRSNMPYTHATILELTRYSSAAALGVPHVCSKDAELRGFDIPRDSLILPNLYRVHHDPNFWENPGIFDPSRFLDDSRNLVAANDPKRRRVIPFGVGKRACMGEVFAKTRLFLYVTSLVQAFTFVPAGHLPSCHPRDFVPVLVVGPPNYSVKVIKRSKQSIIN